jgi:hypothetical protein
LANWFACPLCGRQRPIAGWDPTLFDDEIKIRNLRGRGKGHGFGVDSEWNASLHSAGLDLNAMAERCLAIVGLCLDSREVSADDLAEEVPPELVEAILEENAQR